MKKLLELADLGGGEAVLEVGAGTGSLTEELLQRARRVVAVEVDPVLAEIVRRRLAGRGNLTVLNCDVLAGKHTIAPQVLELLRGEGNVHLVANLPYNVAVPLILNCLLASWRAARSREDRPVCFRRLTFTAQRELVERMTAGAGAAYGPASVIVALLAGATPGRLMRPQSFWPRPKVSGQMLRLDFDADRAARLADAKTLSAVLAAAFGQRRKKVAAAGKRKHLPFPAEHFGRALAQAGVDPAARPEQIRPDGFLALANALNALAEPH